MSISVVEGVSERAKRPELLAFRRVPGIAAFYLQVAELISL